MSDAPDEVGNPAAVLAAAGVDPPCRQCVPDWGRNAGAGRRGVHANWAAISHGPCACVCSWAVISRGGGAQAEWATVREIACGTGRLPPSPFLAMGPQGNDVGVRAVKLAHWSNHAAQGHCRAVAREGAEKHALRNALKRKSRWLESASGAAGWVSPSEPSCPSSPCPSASSSWREL